MQLPVEPPQLAQRVLEGLRIGDYYAGGEHRQVPDADIYPSYRGPAAAGRDMPLDLDSERDIPAVGDTADRGGHDAGSALLQAAGELAGGFMGLERADPGERDVLAVSLYSKWSGGEPAGVPAPTLLPGSWKTDPAASATARLGVREVLEGASEPVQARGVGLLAVVCPPGGDLVLGPVPLSAEGRQCPRHLNVLASPPLLQPLLYQPQPPVVGIPGGTAMGS
jgi:hypothetical protein